MQPFYDEELVEVDDEKVRLAVDFRAITVIEGSIRDDEITPLPEVVAMLYADPPPLSVAGKVLWGLMRRHHPESTLDEAAGLMFGEHGNRIAMAMMELMYRAMNLGKKAKDENPPKRRGASKTS